MRSSPHVGAVRSVAGGLAGTLASDLRVRRPVRSPRAGAGLVAVHKEASLPRPDADGSGAVRHARRPATRRHQRCPGLPAGRRGTMTEPLAIEPEGEAEFVVRPGGDGPGTGARFRLSPRLREGPGLE